MKIKFNQKEYEFKSQEFEKLGRNHDINKYEPEVQEIIKKLLELKDKKYRVILRKVFNFYKERGRTALTINLDEVN